jgi:hypothetical protein
MSKLAFTLNAIPVKSAAIDSFDIVITHMLLCL